MAHDTKETKRDGRWLALIPIGIAGVMISLVMPHATEPVDVPLPTVDRRVIERIRVSDAELAARARTNRLPNDALGLGTAIRAMNAAQAKQSADGVYEARHALEVSGRDVAFRKDAIPDVLTLRAVQLEEFLSALAAFEKSGEETPDFADLGGASFVKRARQAGWMDGRSIRLDEPTRRAMFKVVWNGLSGFERAPELALALDEERVIYTAYLTYPHPFENERIGLEAERQAAASPPECLRAQINERRSTELWRVDKIKKLAQLDPTYPAGYALGVALYRAGRYDASVEAFRLWVDKHPEGPLSLRARNHLKAAVAAAGGI